jgi:hypothetical protein
MPHGAEDEQEDEDRRHRDIHVDGGDPAQTRGGRGIGRIGGQRNWSLFRANHQSITFTFSLTEKQSPFQPHQVRTYHLSLTYLSRK